MLNLMIGLNGYTLCSGVICEELNGPDYAAVPFQAEEDAVGSEMEIGYIVKKNMVLSSLAEQSIREIDRYLRDYHNSKFDGAFGYLISSRMKCVHRKFINAFAANVDK